jgi:hypothetical protein
MGETTTYVYDGQHRLTSVGDFGPPPSPLPPGRKKLQEPKQRSSRKRATGKTPKKATTGSGRGKRVEQQKPVQA